MRFANGAGRTITYLNPCSVVKAPQSTIPGNGNPVSDAVYEFCCNKITQLLNPKIKGNQHRNLTHRNLIRFMKRQKQQRCKIIHNLLHHISGKTGVHRLLIVLFHLCKTPGITVSTILYVNISQVNPQTTYIYG